MFNALFVQNGTALTPSIPKAIAISPDGVNWDYIQKSQIAKITPVYIPFVQASQANAGYPFMDWCQVHIQLTSGSSVKFDAQACINQTGWFTSDIRAGGTATSHEDGLKQAINDISGWL